MSDELYARQGEENSGWINDTMIASAAKAAGVNVDSLSAALSTAPVTRMLKNAGVGGDELRRCRDAHLHRPGAPGASDPAAALRPRSGVVLGGARSAAEVRLRAWIAAAALVGAAIAAYLTYVHYSHTAPICVNSGCETVQKSKYAELGGVPVASAGADRLPRDHRDDRCPRDRRGVHRCPDLVRRRCIQRLSPLGPARPDRSDLPVVPRQRRRDLDRCRAVCGADADRAPATCVVAQDLRLAARREVAARAAVTSVDRQAPVRH